MTLFQKLRRLYATDQQQIVLDAYGIYKLLPATSRADWKTRSGLSQSRFKRAFAELNKRGKLWLFSDGTIEAAGEVAKWTSDAPQTIT